MTEIQQQIIDAHQNKCDLIESGIIRASGVLVREMFSAVEDERLTLEHIRSARNKFDSMLKTFDEENQDLKANIEYYKERDRKAEHDNHQ